MQRSWRLLRWRHMVAAVDEGLRPLPWGHDDLLEVGAVAYAGMASGPKMNESFLTVADVPRILKVNQQTVRNWIFSTVFGVSPWTAGLERWCVGAPSGAPTTPRAARNVSNRRDDTEVVAQRAPGVSRRRRPARELGIITLNETGAWAAGCERASAPAALSVPRCRFFKVALLGAAPGSPGAARRL